MNANVVQEPSKLIQSLCFEDMPLKKKKSKHRLEYLDLTVNNDKTFDVASNSNFSIIRKEDVLIKQYLLNKIVKNVGLSIGCIGTGFVLGQTVSINVWSIGYRILEATNFCFSSVFPNDTLTTFHKVYDPYKIIFDTNNMGCSHGVVYGPIYEELVDRVLLQEFLLKRLPEKILKKFSPKYAHLSNHCVAKITRVFLSSVCFALQHPAAYKRSNGDMYPYLLAGAALGTLQEISGHPFYNIVAHMIANLSNLRCYNRWY